MRVRELKAELTENLRAKRQGLPMPHEMVHADFLALRYCHPKGEMNAPILKLLLGLGLSHFIAPPPKANGQRSQPRQCRQSRR